MTDIAVNLIKLEEGDAEFTARVVRQLKHHSLADPAGFLSQPGAVALVAIADAEPVGWAYGYVLNRPDGNKMMLLYEMEVVPAWRRKGIGRRLVAGFRERAISEGCQSMWLITDDDNVNAQMLYQLEGATADGARLQYAWRQLLEDNG